MPCQEGLGCAQHWRKEDFQASNGSGPGKRLRITLKFKTAMAKMYDNLSMILNTKNLWMCLCLWNLYIYIWIYEIYESMSILHLNPSHPLPINTKVAAWDMAVHKVKIVKPFNLTGHSSRHGGLQAASFWRIHPGDAYCLTFMGDGPMVMPKHRLLWWIS